MKWNAEHERILRAASENRLSINEHGRWVIDGDPRRPAPKERRWLIDQGFITWPHFKTGETITDEGRSVLRVVAAHPEGDE
jgi:hypothetical protein